VAEGECQKEAETINNGRLEINQDRLLATIKGTQHFLPLGRRMRPARRRLQRLTNVKFT